MLYMDYLDEKLIHNETALIDSNGNPIMMNWETDIMRESSNIICSKGGDILNIGFGLGLIDGFIQNHKIKSHTVIECHPDVINNILESEWIKNKNINFIFDKWQNKINNLNKFDGVFYDTWKDEDELFMMNVHNIVKVGGFFSFFNSQYFNPNTKSIPNYFYQILKEHFEISSIQISINYDGYNLENIERYWNNRRKKYWIPVCIRK